MPAPGHKLPILRRRVPDRADGEGSDGRNFEGTEPKEMNRKYDVEIDGYSIRNDADFYRADMSKSERDGKHRKEKLEKRAEVAVLKRYIRA